VGPVPVAIRATNGTPDFAQLSVAKLPEVGPPPPSNEQLAAMLSLSPDDLVGGSMMPESVSCGTPFLFVPVRDRKVLARSRVKQDLFEAALRGYVTDMVFLFAMDPEHRDHHVRARMYAPTINVPEDPATGSACVALGGYLAARDSRTDGTLRWIVEQGFEMGRPSILEVEVDKKNGKTTAARVGGSTVLVCEGDMEL
jgi:trans-2,3-dihydro-3-hydroxyanthranilate isomerase